MTSKFKKFIPYLLFLIPIFLTTNVIDNDFWFTINHGRYLFTNGFTNIEPFTVHEGLAFTFEKWFTSVIFYQVWIHYSEMGVLVLKMILNLFTEISFYVVMNTVSKNKKVNIILSVIITLSMQNFITTRPQSFSFILIICEILFIEQFIKTKNTKYLITLPLISWLYMQVHSTMWILFFIMLMPYIFDVDKIAKLFNLKEGNYRKKPIVIAGLISFIFGFLNPNGYKSVIYLFNSLGVMSTSITELAAPNVIELIIRSGFVAMFFVFYFVYEYSIKTSKNDKLIPVFKELPMRYIYFLSGTLLMSAWAIRNIVYLIICGGIVIAYVCENIKIDFKYFNVVAIAITLIVGFFSCQDIKNPYSVTCGKQAMDELKVIIEEKNIETKDVRLFTGFNTGGYGEWLGFKTYIDPRAEVFLKSVNKKEDILNEYYLLNRGLVSYKDIQQKYNFDYWIVSNKTPSKTYIDLDENYKLIIDKEGYSVYECLTTE